MNPRTRKLMTMYKALHPRDDEDRLYVPKKKEEEDFTAAKNNADNISINRTEITRKQKWKEKQLCRHFK